MGKGDLIMSNESRDKYLGLLEIQLRAARRNTRILGTVLFLSLAALVFKGLVRSIPQREAVLITVLILSFALGFIASLARREALDAVWNLARSILPRE